jgi:hypothetical protein
MSTYSIKGFHKLKLILIFLSGLCGKWSKSKEIECNFFDNDKCITLEDTEKVLEHWRFINELKNKIDK